MSTYRFPISGTREEREDDETPGFGARLLQGFQSAIPAIQSLPGFAPGVLTGIQDAEKEKRQQDRQAVGDFLKIHEQLAKVPPGPGKNYLIEQLGEMAERSTGQKLPKGYLQMLKKQNEDQAAQFQNVLENTVKKYNLGLTEGLLPLLTTRPDLLVDVVSKELDFQRRSAITDREKRDEALRARLLGVLSGEPQAPVQAATGGADATGIPEGTTVTPEEAQRTVAALRDRYTPQGDPTGLKDGEVISPTQAQTLAQTLQKRYGASPRLAEAAAGAAQAGQQTLRQAQAPDVPLQGPTVEVQPREVLQTAEGRSLARTGSGQPLRDKLDARIAAVDEVLRKGLAGLAPTESNERFRGNLEQELTRLQKQRDRLDDVATKEEDRAYRREEAADRKRALAEERALRREDLLYRRQIQEEERPFKNIDLETRTILGARGVTKPTADDISAALDEKRNVAAHIAAQNQRAAAEVQSERVDPVQSRQLASLSTLLGHVKSLEQFTTAELRDWTGPVEGRLQRLEQLTKQDPRYQAFLSSLARTRAALLFSRTDGGGGALTPTEFKVLEDFNVSNVSLDGALGFATNLKQIRRDLEGKINAGAAFTGVQRGQVRERAKQISDDIATQSTTDIGDVQEDFGPKAKAGKERRQRLLSLAPKDIVDMSDAEFDALQPADLQGLSQSQYGALKARAKRREEKTR